MEYKLASLTPFRYPGSKVKLLPNLIKKFIDCGLEKSSSFTDVFVGGGSIFLELARKYPNMNFIINDYDEWIYSFWKVVLSNKYQEFIDLIENIPINIKIFKSLRNNFPKSIIEKAYYALFFNRTTFSGMLKAGPIGGLNQTGKWKIDCRFPKKNIINKIIEINKILSERTKVYNLNFTQLLNDVYHQFIYLDPPYYHKGNQLYRVPMQPDEHINLSFILQNNINVPWIISYDICDEIKNLYYKKSNIEEIFVRYTFKGYTKKEDKKEYLIYNGKKY